MVTLSCKIKLNQQSLLFEKARRISHRMFRIEDRKRGATLTEGLGGAEVRHSVCREVSMRLQGLVLVVILGATPSVRAAASQAESEKLTASALPQFLADFEKSLAPIDSAFDDLENAKLPLLDESGHPLGRRNIQDRRKILSDLRDTVKQLAANPQDLVLTMTLLKRTEALSDDIYDLAQIAFDNDQEELGTRLGSVLTALDHNEDLLESYALSVAAEKEQRLRALEKENQDLEQKLKETRTTKPKRGF